MSSILKISSVKNIKIRGVYPRLKNIRGYYMILDRPCYTISCHIMSYSVVTYNITSHFYSHSIPFHSFPFHSYSHSIPFLSPFPFHSHSHFYSFLENKLYWHCKFINTLFLYPILPYKNVVLIGGGMCRIM